jgi:hypothetical protein
LRVVQPLEKVVGAYNGVMKHISDSSCMTMIRGRSCANVDA